MDNLNKNVVADGIEAEIKDSMAIYNDIIDNINDIYSDLYADVEDDRLTDIMADALRNRIRLQVSKIIDFLETVKQVLEKTEGMITNFGVMSFRSKLQRNIQTLLYIKDNEFKDFEEYLTKLHSKYAEFKFTDEGMVLEDVKSPGTPFSV